MSITDTLAAVVLCNAVIASVYLLANIFACGSKPAANWLPWLLVVALIAATWLLHNQRAGNSAGPNQNVGAQAAGNLRSSAVIPGDTAGAAVNEQVGGKNAGGNVGDQVPNNFWSQIDWGHVIELFLAGAVAGATIILAYLGIRQLVAIKSQISQTQRSLDLTRLQLRPVIVITNITSAAIQPLQGMSLRFTIENHGNSVATVYACQIIPVFGGYLGSQIQRDAMIKYGWTDEGRREIRAEIPPHCPFTSNFNAICPIEEENELTYDRVSEIIKGNLPLYFVVALFFDSAISEGDTYVCTCRHYEHMGAVSVHVLCSEAVPGKRREH